VVRRLIRPTFIDHRDLIHGRELAQLLGHPRRLAPVSPLIEDRVVHQLFAHGVDELEAVELQ
jgi:hypothetical protein